MKRPGDIVQSSKYNSASTLVSNTTTMTNSSAAITSGQGSTVPFWDVAIQATSLANLLDYHAELWGSHHTGACHFMGAVFLDSAGNASFAGGVKIPAADDLAKLIIDARAYPADLNSHTYKLRVGGSAAGTWTLNGVNNTTWLGSSLYSSAGMQEIMV
jgi:hypothetical protein